MNIRVLFLSLSLVLGHHISAQDREPQEDIKHILKLYSNDELSAEDTRLKEQPVGQLTVEDILNKNVKWKSSPRPEIVYDDSGFDYDKVGQGKIPKPGVHPRIVITSKDLPKIKANLESTKNGQKMLSAVSAFRQEFKEGETDYAKFYQSLKANTIFNGDEQNEQLIKSFIPTNVHARDRFATALLWQALYALMYNDNELGEEIGEVAVSYAKLLEQIADKRRKTKSDWFCGSPFANEIIVPTNIAFLYDLCFNYLKKEDRDYMRKLIADHTKETYAHGMELPPHWRRWNFVPISTYFAISALCIEGEEGYEPRIYERSCELMEDYFTYAFSPEGMGTEGMGYGINNFPTNMIFMWAMLRRGDKNLFAHPHFRKVFSGWMLNSMVSGNNTFITHGDLGGLVVPSWVTLQTMKYFYPHDKTIDYLYQKVHTEDIPIYNMNRPFTAILTASDPDMDSNGKFIDYQGKPPVEQALTYFNPMRGNMITRSSWDEEGMRFELDARQDCFYPSHDHADRGNFVLTANKQIWSMDGWRSTETKYHSVVNIDSKSQGIFSTPAQWLDFSDNPQATFGVIDAKYAWDWKWYKTPVADYMQGRIPNPERDYEHFQESAESYLERDPDIQLERDPLRKVADYFSGYMEGNPQIWAEDSWPERSVNLPVKYAYRTGGMVRGKHNYVILVDDICQDDEEHLYEWTMIMPLNVEVFKIDNWDITLGDMNMKRLITPEGHGWKRQQGRFIAEKGNPQLLIRVLDVNEPTPLTRKPSPRLETYEMKKHEDGHQFSGRTMDIGKRLIIPSRAIEPNFKMLMFPYRHGEEKQPKTTWLDEEKTKLSVEWEDQKDMVTFNRLNSGRTTIKIERDGNVIMGIK